MGQMETKALNAKQPALIISRRAVYMLSLSNETVQALLIKRTSPIRR